MEEIKIKELISDENIKAIENKSHIKFQEMIKTYELEIEENKETKIELKPENLIFLLEYGNHYNNVKALEIVDDLLKDLYRGEIFDHIGYGFFNYARKSDWLDPNLEKYLSDNILMAYVYTRGYELFGNDLYMDITNKILYFIFRYLESEEGYYLSIKGNESKDYYLIEKEEVKNLLGDEWGESFCKTYNIKEDGKYKGKNMANLLEADIENLEPSINSMLEMVYEYRSLKKIPKIDKEISTPWNGLFIGVLAYISSVFNSSLYLDKARKLSEIILENRLDKDYQVKAKEKDSLLLDYSLLAYGFLTLYEVTNSKEYLEISEKLIENLDKDLKIKKLEKANIILILDLLKLSKYSKKEEYKLLLNDRVESYI